MSVRSRPDLDEIPVGARVFLDSSIFIYHFTASSRSCRSLLERCQRGEVIGLTSAVALAETLHRLMTIEAVARSFVPPGNVAKKLRARPDIVRKLTLSENQVERIPSMGVEVRALTTQILERASQLRRDHGLMTNDSLLAATAFEQATAVFASADPDFSRLPGLDVYSPDDLET